MKLYLKSAVLPLTLVLFIGFTFSSSFAMGRQAGEDTAKTTQVPKVKKIAKTYSKETGKPYEMTKADSLEVERINKEMIEDDIRYYKPKVPGLIRGLKNEDMERRMLAIEGLEHSRDPRVIEPLLAILKNDSVSTIRSAAAWALETICLYLGQEYSTKAIPGLREALNDKAIRVRYTAARSLVHLGDKFTPIPTLVSIFGKKPDIFRASIEVWVEQEVIRPDLPYSKQIEIAEYARNKAPVRALDLLIEIGGEEVREALEKATKDKDKWVRSKAVEALSQLREKDSGDVENDRRDTYGYCTAKKDWCKMDMKITLSRVPKLNEEVEIILSLTPLDSLYPHAPTDQARIYLQRYGYLELEYIRGDTLWVGEIKKGETVTLKVWAKPVWGGMYRISSNIAYLRREVIDQEKGIYFYTGINKASSDSFFVKGPSKPVDKRRQWHTDKGVRIRMVTDTLEIDSLEVNPIRNDSVPPDTEQHNSIDRLDETLFANSCEGSVIGEKRTYQITASSTVGILSSLAQVSLSPQGRLQ